MAAPIYKLLAPPQLDGDADKKKVGVILLSTDMTTEADLMRMCPHDRMETHTNRVECINPTTPENLMKMQPKLSGAAADIIPGEKLDAIYYACTSASVSIGDDVVTRSIQTAKPQCAVITPALAARIALKTLGASKISILTPYLRETSEPIAAYFDTHHLSVVNVDHFGIADDRDMARIRPDDIFKSALNAIDDDADALFISCTALRSAEVAEQIENHIGRPVITSNQAGAWMILRQIGIRDKIKGYGRIFEHQAPPQGWPS